MATTIEWREADPRAVEAWRASDEVPMRECGQPSRMFGSEDQLLFVDDYTFAWDPSRKAYFPTPNCLPGTRPVAL